MKTAVFFLCLLAVAYSTESEAEDTSLVDDGALEVEEERSCVALGGECNGNDCKCCNKWTYCKCPLWGVLGCSCVFGDSMVCVRKRESCKNPEVMDYPKGSCFSSKRGNNRRGR
uniref:Cystine knot toxin n=1 Tax=Dolomedes sulfureus TaxID=492288 RepID=A0A0P0DIM7_9ARAC|nr:cystine knot toxin [Dolomedes sulfureus]